MKLNFLNIIDDQFDELLNRLEMLSNINTPPIIYLD